jgi:hypothetical protein
MIRLIGKEGIVSSSEEDLSIVESIPMARRATELNGGIFFDRSYLKSDCICTTTQHLYNNIKYGNFKEHTVLIVLYDKHACKLF